MAIDPAALVEWCRIPAGELEAHADLRLPFRIVPDAAQMAREMAGALIDQVAEDQRANRQTRAIVPCGPLGWYEPFAERVNASRQSLASLVVFHMDECLDWQGRLLPEGHPYNFRWMMERLFYDPIDEPLGVPVDQRHWLTPDNIHETVAMVDEAPIDFTFGGWGQDGHIAYNQARRDPYRRLTLEELAASSARIQENNTDTRIAMSQRTFGGAYQFTPPMSVTLGLRECLGAKRVRLYSDTGAWKQTALRIALFSEPDPDYPVTLLQRHPDALLTATAETADHPLAHHPEWRLI